MGAAVAAPVDAPSAADTSAVGPAPCPKVVPLLGQRNVPARSLQVSSEPGLVPAWPVPQAPQLGAGLGKPSALPPPAWKV